MICTGGTIGVLDNHGRIINLCAEVERCTPFLVASHVARTLVGTPITSTSAHAWCTMDVVIIKGRVQHPPRNSSVRVRLLYPKKQSGEERYLIL